MAKKAGGLRRSGKVIITVGALVLTVGLAAGAMLEANSGQVNNYLGTSTTKITGGGDYDTYTPDEQYLNEDGSANTDALVQAHIDLGTKVEEEGAVLLKNDNNCLPLSSDELNVTLLGVRSSPSGMQYGMSVGSPEEDSQNVSLYDALTSLGFNVNPTVSDAYESLSSSSNEVTIDSAIEAAGGEEAWDNSIEQYGDVGIVVIGRTAHEATDKTYNAYNDSDLSITRNEASTVMYAAQHFDKVVVLINASNAVELHYLLDIDNVDAILWIGQPGNYGTYGVGNILLGNANPSGKLVDTYAVDSGGSPSMENFGDYTYANADAYVNSLDLGNKYVMQTEGIYIGYKYYETRYEDSVINPSSNATASVGVSSYESSGSAWNYANEVTYSFGYGLSYTTFDQSIDNVEFSDDGRTATVTVTVENTGDVAGKDVVQVYAQSPYTDYDKEYNVEKASVQLLGYEKTDIIEPNESETIYVELDLQYLASYDSEGKGTYIMESGDDAKYYFVLGTNDEESGAHAAINNILAKKGYSSETNSNMVGDGDASLAYEFEWNYDEDLFSTSKDGTEITNQLEDLDYNYYNPGTITYLSRSDWQGTWPTTYSQINIVDSMVSVLRNDYHSTTNSDTSDILFGQDGEYLFTDMFGADFDDERWDDVLDQVTLQSAVNFTATGNRTFYEISEINFLSSNAYTENGTVGIQKTLDNQSDEYAPWYVSPEDPNADFACNTLASSVVQASTWNKDLMEEIGELWGNDALFVNIPMIWAPAINLHRNPYNGRNGEYFSEDPIISGYSALKLAVGCKSKGLIAVIKHFAFNQQETNRCGVSTFMTEQAAREGELRGFQIAIEGEEVTKEDGTTENVGALGIMTAFNRAGATYAGGHYGLMQGILRDEWGYKGYITSDLLNQASTYMSYEESMLAGTTNFDLTTTGQTIWYDDDYSTRRTLTSIAEDVANDADVLSAIKDNLHYALYAFSQSNLANWMTSTTQTVWAWNWWRAAYYSAEIVGGVFIVAGAVMYIVGVALSHGKKVQYVYIDEDDEEEGGKY